MDGSEILAFFNNLIGDELDEDFAYDLMTHAKDSWESERDWEILKVVDETKTTSGNYLTAKALPTTFQRDRKLYVGDDRVPWIRVPFEERERWKDIYRRWYLDMANSNFHICGSPESGKTLRLFFVKTTPDMASDVTPVWPARFHKIIAFVMAEIHQSGLDADDMSFRMTPQQIKQGNALKNNMLSWDDALKEGAQDGTAEPPDFETYPNVVY